MINPSVHGWIDKFFVEQKLLPHPLPKSEIAFYNQTRATGFIFGNTVSFDSTHPIDTANRLPQEISKIGLLNTLYQMFRLQKQMDDSELFIYEAIQFYSSLVEIGFNTFQKILISNTPSHKLEKILHDRVQTNEDLITKNFSHVITNALLFIDILAFKQYLEKRSISDKYLTKIEAIVISIVSLSLKTKTNISQHDDLLLKLFDASVRYTKFSDTAIKSISDLELSFLQNDLEKLYMIDLASISLWSDAKVENEERYFLYKLGDSLRIDDTLVLTSINFVNSFIENYKKEIPYFNFSNPVKQFYDQTSDSVSILLNRNKKRLLKEISESKELMQLLAKSTHKDLDKDEKKKVKRQLLDVCKTIPSLAIFLLPGGSLLLPLMIKFIPAFLPSSFNENTKD